MFRRTKDGQLQRSSQDGRSGTGARASEAASASRTGLVTQAASQRPGEVASAREPFTYVHRGTVINGEVVGTGRVRVHGEIKGNVRIDGVLEVAESGSVVGEMVEAREVKVLGRIKANVVAGGKVEIWKGGVLIGDVRAAALDIEEGATFNGFSHMLDDVAEAVEEGHALEEATNEGLRTHEQVALDSVEPDVVDPNGAGRSEPLSDA